MRLPRVRFTLRPRVRTSTLMLAVLVAGLGLALVAQQERAARREAAMRSVLRAQFDGKLAELAADLRDLRREALDRNRRAFLRREGGTNLGDVQAAYSKHQE